MSQYGVTRYQLINGIYYTYTGLILSLHPANERRRYKVMASFIGWAQT